MKRTNEPRIIETDADIRAGVRALRRKCTHLRRVHEQVGDPPLRRVSIAIVLMAPAAMSALADKDLRAAGLSRAKVTTLRAIAEAVENGLNLEQLAGEPEDSVHQALTAVHDVGPWTADIYMLFCIGRADAFAAGDLALQTATGIAFGLTGRPFCEELLAIAERWRPWRGVAARMLWAFYMQRPGFGVAPNVL